MENKNIYGLIGKNINYSFSKAYFLKKFKKDQIIDSDYLNFDIETIDLIEDIFKTNKLSGLNVTIPYKEKIIPFIDELSPVAKEIGSVNTICFNNSKKIGYNTDIFGFDKTLSEINIDNIKHALVLGTGGASKAIRYVLSKRKINYTLVSRNKKEDSILYNDLDANLFNQNLLIINSTPLGTYPFIEEFPDIPYKYLDSKHILYDLVYNPIQTSFMKKGIEKGARVINGLKMLEYQAEKSWELWCEFN
ncbi:MAG: shikimate dehydrogenase family protein [Candidatus Marisimplicoccus sp.]